MHRNPWSSLGSQNHTIPSTFFQPSHLRHRQSKDAHKLVGTFYQSQLLFIKETMNTAMYWKGMRTTIRSLTKSCRSCQINKRRSRRYGHLPPKTVITNPWKCLCVDLIGPYTLKGNDNLHINFVALTIISPASSWFKIAELP